MRPLAILLLAACTPRHGIVPAPAPAVLPLVHTDVDAERWYTLLTLPDGTERAWFVDTGYGRTTCDDDLVMALGVRARGRVRTRGEGGRTRAKRARLPAFTIGDHQVRRLRCVVRDLPSTSSIRAPGAGHVAGVIGSDVLRRFHVVLDPAEATLALRHPDVALPRGEGVLPLRREQGWSPRMELRVGVDGATLPMVVDTGATRTFLDGNRCGLDPFETRTVRVAGTGGTDERHIALYRVGLSVGPVQRRGLVVFDRPRGRRTRGLLGLDALGTVRLELDARHGLARLSEVEVSQIPVWAP